MTNLEHKLNLFYEEARDFIVEANKYLASNNQLYFSGEIFSGNPENPTILFLSINPGYASEDWKSFQGSPKGINLSGFKLKPCKYIDETNKYPLASKISNIFFDGDLSKYKFCAETYFKSFFATPNEGILNQQLSMLPNELQQKHLDIMQKYRRFIFESIMPEHLVCVGLSVFNKVVNLLHINSKDIFMHSYQTVSGKSERVYHKEVKYGSTTIHGILHLSGAHISRVAIDKMKDVFGKII